MTCTQVAMSKAAAIFIILMIPFGLFAQEYYSDRQMVYENKVYDPNIRSVKLAPNGNPIALAMIGLNSNEKLKLSFDDLGGEIKEYSYSFEHCTPNWESSELNFLDYCDGIDNVFITDYDFSGITKTKYLRYEAVFPNDQVKFRFSGNYLLKVYENGDLNLPVLTMRFMVYEKRVGIQANIHRPTLAEYRFTHQEVDFSIFSPGYELTNPYSDMQVNIMKNGRWDNMIEGIPPLFVKDKEIEFNYEEENLFPGGNEYRFIDLRNSNFSGGGVGQSFSRNDTNFVFLRPDKSRGIKVYQDQPDINGAWTLEVNDMMYDSDMDADYANVFFSINSPSKIEGHKVYVIGEFTGRKLSPEYEMTYDPKLGVYKLNTMLKQGYYNYLFVTKKEGESDGKTREFEGDHAQTENNYTILVYHKRIQDRHIRLIAAQHFQINF